MSDPMHMFHMDQKFAYNGDVTNSLGSTFLIAFFSTLTEELSWGILWHQHH